MNGKVFIILLFIGVLAGLIFSPSDAHARETCTDAAGGPIPCPTTEPQKPEKKTPRPTKISPTDTYTPSPTSTSTQTQTPSFTPSITRTATEVPSTNTQINTATQTPVPQRGAEVWLPGIGIGAFILFIIVGIFLPVMQKIKVAGREQ